MELVGHKVCSCFILSNLVSSFKHALRLLNFSFPVVLPCSHLKYPPSASTVRSVSWLAFFFYPQEKTSSHLSWKVTKQCRPHRLPDYYTYPSTYHKETGDRDLAHHKDTQVWRPFLFLTKAQSPHCISTETFPPFKAQTQFPAPSIFLPHSHLTPYFKCFSRRKLQRRSSSEGSREKREAPGMLKQKKPMPQKRL